MMFIVSVAFTGVETSVSSNSVNIKNTFYLLWYACPWWTELPKIKLGINLGHMFISDWNNLLEEWCLYWFWIKKVCVVFSFPSCSWTLSWPNVCFRSCWYSKVYSSFFSAKKSWHVIKSLYKAARVFVFWG